MAEVAVETLLNSGINAEEMNISIDDLDPHPSLIDEEAMLIEDEAGAPEKSQNASVINLDDSDETVNVEGALSEPEVKDEAEKVQLDAGTETEASTKSEEASPEDAALVKTVTVAEEDVEDDIICLDDEEDEETSGASDSKRPRKDEDGDIMEVDENGQEKKEAVGKVIRTMSRKDLEDLVLAKIVEAIVAHTEVGQLRAKVLELQMQKDKMANKIGVMQKQVAELSNAINTMVENEAREPKSRIGKAPPIRFNRSVGLQTSLEPSFRTPAPRIIRVPEAPQNGVKQYGGTTSGKASSHASASASSGTFAKPPAPGVKRVYQGSSSKGNESTTTSNTSQRKACSSASGGPPRIPIAPKPPSSSVTTTPTSAPLATASSVQPGIVDLTDDDTPATASTSQGGQSTVSGTTFINGVQYQVVNRSSGASGGVQLVSPGNPSQRQSYTVLPAGSNQTRPVVVQQLGVAAGTTQQQVVFRGNSPVTIIPRPVAPRPPTNGNMPRVAATIPVRPSGVLGASTNTPGKFVLPPLPITPPPKLKNDVYKPPPRPDLTLNEQADGIVLSWNLPTINNMAEVTTYQIFACQESLNNSTSRPSQWKRVGDVKALPLPMACTLSQFTEENRYHFIVRGIDVYGRTGPFCEPQSILLRKKK